MGGGYGIGLPLVGKLLHLMWDGKIVNGIHKYSIDAYQKAFISIPVGILLAIIMVLFIKETRCKSIVEKK